MIIITLVLFSVFSTYVSYTKVLESSIDRYIISCHTTDISCFKRQYQSLRDNILLGNKEMEISPYNPYVFQYGESGTCVRMTGVEESDLVDMNLNSTSKHLSMVLTLPVRVQQILPKKPCAKSDREFVTSEADQGVLKKFSGNATVDVTFPYKLLKKMGEVYMILGDESLDVILDMPDLTNYDKSSALELKLYQWSEWAYDVVQHVDVAQHSIMPYTGQVKKVFDRLPVGRFILLYPEEEFTDLSFKFSDTGL